MRLAKAYRKLRGKTAHQWMVLVGSLGMRLRTRFYYRLLFGSLGRGSLVGRPAVLGYPEYIHIGAETMIRAGARLEAVPVGARVPELRIGSSVNIEQNVHIVCHNRIRIGDRVSITANCSIVDTTHQFEGISEEAKGGALVLDDDGFVEIGDGSFLGIGTVVLPFVRIGRRCVIGANSVVTRDIPDDSVAWGAPAVVRRTMVRV